MNPYPPGTLAAWAHDFEATCQEFGRVLRAELTRTLGPILNKLEHKQ
jgi:hypothetical protein